MFHADSVVGWTEAWTTSQKQLTWKKWTSMYDKSYYLKQSCICLPHFQCSVRQKQSSYKTLVWLKAFYGSGFLTFANSRFRTNKCRLIWRTIWRIFHSAVSLKITVSGFHVMLFLFLLDDIYIPEQKMDLEKMR